MKTKAVLLTVALAVVGGSLQAQFGPPRKPGDAEAPKDGRRPGGKSTPSPVRPAPAPKIAPVPTPSPKVVPSLPPVVKPSVPTPTPGPVPRSLPPGVPGGPSRERTKLGPIVIPRPVPIVPPTGPAVEVRRPIKVNPLGPKSGPSSGITFDIGFLRGAFGAAPRKIAPPPGPRVVRPPGAVFPLVRVYDRERSVIVVTAEDGDKTELPFVEMPLLFSAGTSDLLDRTAGVNLQALASSILELYAQGADVRFQIEGHASADEDAPGTQQLSLQRASHVYAELISRYGVPAAILSVKGYGATYAQFPKGTTEQQQLDRRVLVVRTN